MSANKSDRGLALMQAREREEARTFSPAYLLQHGGQAVVICRECRHFDFLDLGRLPPGVDLRAHEVHFRCRAGHRAAFVGIARSPQDGGYVPPWRRR